jgi:hypothetical protein
MVEGYILTILGFIGIALVLGWLAYSIKQNYKKINTRNKSYDSSHQVNHDSYLDSSWSCGSGSSCCSSSGSPCGD